MYTSGNPEISLFRIQHVSVCVRPRAPPFARKDEIADWAMKTRDKTPYLDPVLCRKTGLSGPSA
jgi:hypothetical protein